MKRKLSAAVAVGLCLCLTLTACSPKETAQELLYKLVVAMGFASESDDEEEASTDVYAAEGGVVTYPEGMDTESRFSTMASGDTLYVHFNGIMNRNTPYFTAAGSSVTITAFATTESTGLLEFKGALWELSDDEATTQYVQGSTVYFSTGGGCYTQTITGLTPGKQYKVNISYDSGAYYITGGMTVQGLGGEELNSVEEE